MLFSYKTLYTQNEMKEEFIKTGSMADKSERNYTQTIHLV